MKYRKVGMTRKKLEGQNKTDLIILHMRRPATLEIPRQFKNPSFHSYCMGENPSRQWWRNEEL